ncbi:hypothetical protein [Zhongshania sp. BJYM1]|uniref:hypothetical protein n=1 Tax=Zhongshania aquatica TaxID=2965069 RepID=UPI0022B38D62|nr:hypothetical protein [Marortus sp. BJYM1]
MRKDVKTKVVITHFPPCLEVDNEDIGMNMLTPYFQANCRDLIEQYQPSVWVFGHNHYSHDIKIKETRLVSNQRGYPGEQVKYNEKLLINVPEIK